MSKTSLKVNTQLNRTSDLNKRKIEQFEYNISIYQEDLKRRKEANLEKESQKYSHKKNK